MAMEASMASLRPWREESGTSLIEAGASSESSLARFLIPIIVWFCLTGFRLLCHLGMAYLL